MKDLKGVRGKYYISRLIEEGEHEHQDFKFAISDARKIARSISAFANNDGGRLLIGVKDNGAVAGVRNEEDIFVVEQAAEMYCSPQQKIEVKAFRAEGDKTVFRIDIAKALRRPVMVKESGGIMKAYYRVKDENIVAPELMLRAWKAATDRSDGVMINLSQVERHLLALIEESDVSVEELMIAAHISRSYVEELVVNLHAMKLLDFVYDGHSFRLHALLSDR